MTEPEAGPDFVQLLDADGNRVENADFTSAATPESLLADLRDMVLVRRIDSEATALQRKGELGLWPPLLGQPTAGMGVDASKLGSFQRADDASTQATYNGWPLYYWKDDKAPGDVLGQNVNEVWFVINAAGDAVKGSS